MKITTREKILNFLLDNSEEKFYLTQIARGTAVPDSTVQHVLEKQIGEDFLTKEKMGNLSFYQLKKDDPLVKQAKITRTLKEIAFLIKKLKEVSQKIILFGSCAQGENTNKSDVDLFVLANEKRFAEEVIRQVKTGREIRAIIKTYPEWLSMKEREKYLLSEINKGRALWEQKHE